MTSEEIIKTASAISNSQTIDVIVNLLKQYKQDCRLLRRTPDDIYEIAVIKAVSCIGFTDGFKRAYQETGSEVRQP